MARPRTPLLTERETEIMSVLWELGSASADEVRCRLSGDPHDSSVRTMLRVLVEKGHVVANKKVRPTAYRPAVRQTSMRKQVTRDLLKKFFAGSAEDLVLHLLEDEELSSAQLAKIEAAYRQRKSDSAQD